MVFGYGMCTWLAALYQCQNKRETFFILYVLLSIVNY